MDRVTTFPSALPLSADFLRAQQNATIGLGYALQALAGQTTAVDGLVLSPTAPASLTVTVGPGSITSLGVIDATSYGSLAANLAPLVKQGVNTTSSSFTLAAPPSSGQSTNYLIQAQVLESDQVPVVLPYYNAANPAQPYAGPGNAGTSQNTQRNQRVQLLLKAGAPATAGTQATPGVDAGWIGLYVITVSFGQSQITSGNLTNSQLVTAPFVDPLRKGRGVLPGRILNIQVFSTPGTITYVPSPGTNSVMLEVQGAGGGGGAAAGPGSGAASTGGGGSAGSYGKSFLPISAIGTSQVVTVGTGGAGGTGGGDGGVGTASSFGSLVSAPGGNGGTGGPASTTSNIGASAPAPSAAVGGNILNMSGASGWQGFFIPAATGGVFGGSGGNSAIAPGGGKAGIDTVGNVGQYGSGGGGAASGPSGGGHGGGRGGHGVVIVTEYT